VLELCLWRGLAWNCSHFLLPWTPNRLRRSSPADADGDVDLAVDVLAIGRLVPPDRFSTDSVREHSPLPDYFGRALRVPDEALDLPDADFQPASGTCLVQLPFTTCAITWLRSTSLAVISITFPSSLDAS